MSIIVFLSNGCVKKERTIVINLELLECSINASIQAYFCLSNEEKDMLNKDYDYYRNLELIRRITEEVLKKVQDKK